MDVLVVGTLAFDSVDTPRGARQDVLGGSGSFLAMAASYFGPVQLAGVVGQDFPQEHLELFTSRGIDVSNVQQIAGNTFRWHGHYTPDMNTAQTISTDLNVLKSFDPKLNDAAKQAKCVVLGNFDPRLQLQVLDQIKAPAFVACDTMNYWIERQPEALRQTLGRIDLLCVNEAEARQLSGCERLMDAAAAILAMGTRYVVIKRGESGALLVYEGGAFATPAYPLGQLTDPTGAGDSFAGSLVGFLARQKRLDADAMRHAVAIATVMASFVIEDFSLDRLRTLDAHALKARVEHFYALTALRSQGLQW